MQHGKGADRRRNVFDIVADLGFLDRKPAPPRAEPPSADAPVPAAPPPAAAAPVPASPVPAPPALTLVKPPSQPELAQTLTEAQQRAVEQRMAAERMLQEALDLERRLADEAAQARATNEQALGHELAAGLDDVRAAEREAAEHAEVCAKNFERIATQKAQAEALQADDRATRRAAADDVAAMEARIAEARRRLEIADAACTESDRRVNDASAAEAAARAEAATASDVLAVHRAAREAMEQQLSGIRERAAAFGGGVVTDAATRIAERRAADAAKRAADRRAADAQRGAAS